MTVNPKHRVSEILKFSRIFIKFNGASERSRTITFETITFPEVIRNLSIKVAGISRCFTSHRTKLALCPTSWRRATQVEFEKFINLIVNICRWHVLRLVRLGRLSRFACFFIPSVRSSDTFSSGYRGPIFFFLFFPPSDKGNERLQGKVYVRDSRCERARASRNKIL